MKGDGKKEGKDASRRFTTSPYYLSTSDNPGNIITQVQLKGDNYDEWARAMRTTLRAKKKFGFIDGTIAKELWNDIKKRFSVGNGPRIQQLKTELARCKQQGMAVVSYYGKLKMIWEELGNYEQNPMCDVEDANATLGTELDKRREERLHQFLMGLDDSTYGTVRSNILSTEPLPNLNRAYAMIVQEERVRHMTQGREQRGEPMAFLFKQIELGKAMHWINMRCAQTVVRQDIMQTHAFSSLGIQIGGEIDLKEAEWDKDKEVQGSPSSWEEEGVVEVDSQMRN
ncbi:hypothetical protein Patl1_14686 [Pistacia atlantica]|uniref:Uncharacterized protein n=1 Tax=Pistacia atlantica TaxID=434234 RepID=A0ACC1AYB2_9ROSI|nr:hypothetical protein Patl1_14686 [Pistacia atlantica]